MRHPWFEFPRHVYLTRIREVEGIMRQTKQRKCTNLFVYQNTRETETIENPPTVIYRCMRDNANPSFLRNHTMSQPEEMKRRKRKRKEGKNVHRFLPHRRHSGVFDRSKKLHSVHVSKRTPGTVLTSAPFHSSPLPPSSTPLLEEEEEEGEKKKKRKEDAQLEYTSDARDSRIRNR